MVCWRCGVLCCYACVCCVGVVLLWFDVSFDVYVYVFVVMFVGVM